MATEVRERVIRWENPFAALERIKHMSGLEAMRGILEGTLPQPPYAQLLGVRISEVDEGRVVFEADPGEEHYNPMGVVHGGFAMSLLDFALGSAVSTTLSAGSSYGTVDVHARLLRPITKDTGTVRCEATVVSATRSIATSEGRIIDRNGRILATGTTACAIKILS